MSWHECMRQSSRMGLSLPSEAQWEYACRAATSTAWWTGAERRSLLDRRAANFADRAAGRARAGWSDIRDWPELDDGYPLHAPVATFAANPWGLYDVHGNVWEWCLDGYDSVFYAQSPKLDPCAPWKGVKNGVLRGGSYTDAVIRGHSANRAVASRAAALNNMGFRPCRAITK
ncbi:MAG: formylglycine-generating enzyme family protein [Planctomycetes bacterium]|nr:formylglycine-generating enzyme family protein [Planctomycetota bacterium]